MRLAWFSPLAPVRSGIASYSAMVLPSLAARHDIALFVGDDVNDEAVFRIAAPDWLTVRVGRDAIESRARFCLEAIDEVAVLLALLRSRLTAHRPSAHP